MAEHQAFARQMYFHFADDARYLKSLVTEIRRNPVRFPPDKIGNLLQKNETIESKYVHCLVVNERLD
jgi:hypothetical protein